MEHKWVNSTFLEEKGFNLIPPKNYSWQEAPIAFYVYDTKQGNLDDFVKLMKSYAAAGDHVILDSRLGNVAPNLRSDLLLKNLNNNVSIWTRPINKIYSQTKNLLKDKTTEIIHIPVFQDLYTLSELVELNKIDTDFLAVTFEKSFDKEQAGLKSFAKEFAKKHGINL